MSAVMLAPRELAVEQAGVDRRHPGNAVILFLTEVLRLKQAKHRTCRNRRHVTSLLVEPMRITPLGYAVADKRESRRAQRDQLMGVYGKITGVLAAERRFRRA